MISLQEEQGRACRHGLIQNEMAGKQPTVLVDTLSPLEGLRQQHRAVGSAPAHRSAGGQPIVSSCKIDERGRRRSEVV